MNLPKPFTTLCSLGLCPPCASSRGRWLIPLEIWTVWGLWEPPVQFSLAFGSQADWMSPCTPCSQLDPYLIPGVTFPTSQRRCCSPQGDPVPSEPGLGVAGVCIRGAPGPQPVCLHAVMLHSTDPCGSVSIPTCSVRWTFVESLFL